MFALVAVICFAIATLDHPVDDWSLPWMLPLGLTFLAAEVLWQVREGTWRRH